MRKEVLWAIVAGIVLGLIVAFGVFRINSKLSANKKADPMASPTPQAGTIGEFKIVLDKPENADVITEDSVTVSGLTKPLAWVTLSGESGDFTIQSDSTGVFSQAVDLTPGVNQIKATAFNPAGSQSATGVLVVYSSSFVERTLPVSSPAGVASGTSDIRAKVAQDVANTLNHPKAYIGTVTDITDSTIQIKTTGSVIAQISVKADGTTVVNSVGTTSKTVKITDIAIGDFIVAMGYIEGNSVLSAQRILITTPVTESKIDVKLGKVSDIVKKSVTSKTNIEIYENGATKSAKFSDLAQTDQVIYVNTIDANDKAILRSIFVIPQSQG